MTSEHRPVLTYTIDDDGIHLVCPCGHDVPLGFDLTPAIALDAATAHRAEAARARLAGDTPPEDDQPLALEHPLGLPEGALVQVFLLGSQAPPEGDRLAGNAIEGRVVRAVVTGEGMLQRLELEPRDGEVLVLSGWAVLGWAALEWEVNMVMEDGR